MGGAGNSLVYSEQFRSVDRTRRTVYGRLRARWAGSGGGGSRMRRREFLTLLGAAAAGWPLAARAQQPGPPLVGYLHGGSPESRAPMIAAFRQGLAEAGWIDGQNV